MKKGTGKAQTQRLKNVKAAQITSKHQASQFSPERAERLARISANAVAVFYAVMAKCQETGEQKQIARTPKLD